LLFPFLTFKARREFYNEISVRYAVVAATEIVMVRDQPHLDETVDISRFFFRLKMRLSYTRVFVQPHKHILSKMDRIDSANPEGVTLSADRP
jgi:hypothetical protein